MSRPAAQASSCWPFSASVQRSNNVPVQTKNVMPQTPQAITAARFTTARTAWHLGQEMQAILCFSNNETQDMVPAKGLIICGGLTHTVEHGRYRLP